MANKIKYGLKNVHYALATIADDGSATFDKPKKFPGAVSISLEEQGDQEVFYADNIAYFVGVANNGYEGDLEMAKITDDFKKDVLGYEVDTKGALIERANPKMQHFALLFQFEGDISGCRYVLFNCTAGRPGISSETKNDSITPNTESISINVGTIFNESFDDDITRAEIELTDTTKEEYNKWFDTVHIPEKAPA